MAVEIAEDWEIPLEEATEMTNVYARTLETIRDGTGFVDGYNTKGGIRKERTEAFRLWVNTVFFRKDLPVVLYARNGAGKTYFLSWLLLNASIMRPDGDFISNIPWYWDTNPAVEQLRMPNFHNVSRMTEMLRLSSESVLNNRSPYIIIDEMDNAVSSQGFRSREYESWKKFTYIKRHLRMRGPVLAYHSLNDIPLYMRKRQVVGDLLKVYIHGPDRYVFSAQTRPYRLKITGLPIPYSRMGFSDFAIDVDMQKLRLRIGNTSQVKETARRILDNLQECSFDAYRRAEEEEDRNGMYRDICDLKAEGLTYRDIQERMKISSVTVRKALEWCEKHGKQKKSSRDGGGDEGNE